MQLGSLIKLALLSSLLLRPSENVRAFIPVYLSELVVKSSMKGTHTKDQYTSDKYSSLEVSPAHQSLVSCANSLPPKQASSVVRKLCFAQCRCVTLLRVPS